MARKQAAAVETVPTDPREQVEYLRAKIGDLQGQLEALDDGSVPKAEYLARIEGWLDHQAREFSEGAEYALSALRLPQALPRDASLLRLPVRGAADGGALGHVVAECDIGGLLAFLFADVLKTRLGELIQKSDYPEGPPSADRARLRREIKAELDRLEFDEERLIEAAERDGVQIPRRPDARPEIILSLKLKEVA